MSVHDKPFIDDSQPLSEQAAHWWFVVRDADCTADERRAFAQWVQRSPQHVAAFLRVSSWSQRIKAGHITWPDDGVDQLLAQVHGTDQLAANVIALVDRRQRPRQPRQVARTLWPAARRTLAGLAATLIAGWGIWIMQSPHLYQTAVGEQRSVLLDDGSLVTLNTDSSIEVKYRRDHRAVRLLRGEALFKVAHDVHRPFDVQTDQAVIRAVGTQFNVDRHLPGTTVSVLEGKVRVSVHEDLPRPHWLAEPAARESPAKFVSARQQVKVTAGALSPLNTLTDPQAVVAWTERQIVFAAEPLQSVAEQFNRYNREHIVIDDAELRVRQVTGVFQANDAQSFLAFIAAIPGTEIVGDERGDHVVRLRP